MHEIGNAVPRRVIAQQAADDGLFCFDGMRGNAERLDLRVCWGIHGANYTRLLRAAEMIGEFPRIKKAGRTRLFHSNNTEARGTVSSGSRFD
jgi:hypothetical protein